MTKRMILMLSIVIAFIAIIGGFKFFQIKAAIAQQSSFQMPPETVTTIVVKPEQWGTTINAIGTVNAVNGVTVSADLPGVVEQIAFDSGRSVNKGDVLVRLDTKQERAQLTAAEAQRDLTRLAFERNKDLLAKGIVPQSNYDQAAAEWKQAEARAGEIRATIERKTIRAPFSGVLGIRQINLGQYLAAGQAIVPLQAINPIYVNFGVPQQTSAQLLGGRTVRVTSDDLPGAGFTGRVTAVDSVINEATRNIQVQATLSNPQGKLRPGMFVQVELGVGANRQVITLPASAINYAPYGDSVFVVGELKDPKGKTYLGVRQQFVKVGGSRGDQIAIVSGLNPGDEVVSSGVFKLRNGAGVKVNNKVQPPNNPKPKPEDS